MGAERRPCCGLLRGELSRPRAAFVRADALRLVYFSQMRELDENLTLRRALAPEGDGLVYQGRNMHVASWAARFLFTGEQLNQPVRNLSGGERARVLIAKLMLEPADVLLLDEPTNDLDIPTLEILEENLLDFPGALVLVTHDRYLLNRVASTVLGLDGNGHVGQFADYAQWEAWIDQGVTNRDQDSQEDQQIKWGVLRPGRRHPRKRSSRIWRRGSLRRLSSGWSRATRAWLRLGRGLKTRRLLRMRRPWRPLWGNRRRRSRKTRISMPDGLN